MDYVLNIIIPKKEIGNIDLNEKMIEWGGHLYSCDPPRYITSSNIIFEQVENARYFSTVIGKDLGDDTIILDLKSEILFDLEYGVNIDKARLKEDKLLAFLSGLFSLSRFFILLAREDEKVKQRYRVEKEEDISVRLCNSLKRSDPTDILLYKE